MPRGHSPTKSVARADKNKPFQCGNLWTTRPVGAAEGDSSEVPPVAPRPAPFRVLWVQTAPGAAPLLVLPALGAPGAEPSELRRRSERRRQIRRLGRKAGSSRARGAARAGGAVLEWAGWDPTLRRRCGAREGSIPGHALASLTCSGPALCLWDPLHSGFGSHMHTRALTHTRARAHTLVS